MHEHIQKPKTNGSMAPANSIAQKKSNAKQDFRFVDNRREAKAKFNIRDVMANTTPHAMQLAAKVGYKKTIQRKFQDAQSVIQRDTTVKLTTQDYEYEPGKKKRSDTRWSLL